MIGDFRDAIRETLGRVPIEDDTLSALLLLAFASQNVSIATGAGNTCYGHNRLARHAATLFDSDRKLAFDMETLRVAVRLLLMDVFSCRENTTNSAIVARIAGEEIGADGFLPNTAATGDDDRPIDDEIQPPVMPALPDLCERLEWQGLGWEPVSQLSG